MFVSVLLPAYNAEKTVAESIESILNQTYPHFELLLINDGSTDGTLDIMRNYEKADARARIISHENMGKGESLNHAISVAQHDWIALMDADDISLPNRLERQLSFLKQNPDVRAASCLGFYIDENSRILGKTYHDLTTRAAFEHYLESGEAIGLLNPGAIMYKPAFLSVGGYRRIWPAEDIDLWNRLAESGYLILVQPEYLVKYRIHGSSATTRKQMETRLKYEWVRECMWRRRAGQPEITYEQFLSEMNSKPLLWRINKKRKRYSKYHYRTAGYYYATKSYGRFLFHIVASALLQPSYALKKLYKQKL